MANETTRYKDSVFTDLFYSDMNAEKNLLSLYNALYGTDYQDAEDVDKCRLEDVIFMNFKNDTAAIIGKRHLFLSEQQATVNDNMPLRMLLYVAREYERLVDKRKRYRRRSARIPTPEFVTFYNGMEPFPAEKILKLSDSFMDMSRKPELELCVRVININTDGGNQLLKECRILREYSEFVEMARECLKTDPESGLEAAVKRCIKENILTEYLTRKSSEVINMLMEEYSYQDDLEENRREAREEGAMLKLIQQICKKLAKGQDAAAIADALEEDESEVQRIASVAETFAPDYDAEEIYLAIH